MTAVESWPQGMVGRKRSPAANLKRSASSREAPDADQAHVELTWRSFAVQLNGRSSQRDFHSVIGQLYAGRQLRVSGIMIEVV